MRKRVDKEEVWNRKMAFEEESLERNKSKKVAHSGT